MSSPNTFSAGRIELLRDPTRPIPPRRPIPPGRFARSASKRESEIRKWPNPFRISATPVSNREKTPTSRWLAAAHESPITNHDSRLLIETSTIRNQGKSRPINNIQNPNRDFLPVSQSPALHESPIANRDSRPPNRSNSPTGIAATYRKQRPHQFLIATRSPFPATPNFRVSSFDFRVSIPRFRFTIRCPK